MDENTRDRVDWNQGIHINDGISVTQSITDLNHLMLDQKRHPLLPYQ